MYKDKYTTEKLFYVIITLPGAWLHEVVLARQLAHVTDSSLPSSQSAWQSHFIVIAIHDIPPD